MAYKEKRFCAFCKNLRTYYTKKHISALDFFICAAASLAFMALVWQDFNIKVFYFFMFSIVCSEILVKLRWRMKMICQICGFDPILYKKDSQMAADRVKLFLAHREHDPRMLLKPYPKLTPIKKQAVRPKLTPPTQLVKKPDAKAASKSAQIV